MNATATTKRKRLLTAIGLTGAWSLLLSLTVECSHVDPYVRDPADVPRTGVAAAEQAPLLQRLILIGDAGKNVGQTPILEALTARAQRAPDKTTIIFLGDNIYPDGLQPEGHPNHELSKQRLLSQVQAAKSSGAEFFFVPGNHDWAQGAPEGLANVEREAALVTEQGGVRAHYAPEPGYPGPSCVDRPQVRLVFLDTQWFIHQHEKKPADTSFNSSAETAFEQVAQCASQSAAYTVLVGHHPMHTLGIHGNFYSFKQHLFPLTDWHDWMYLPLPIVGSLYPLVRSQGVSRQDLPHKENSAIFERLRAATQATRPLLYAAGHEHGLQVHESPQGPQFSLVSGSGSTATPVGSDDATLYAHEGRGFMELDFTADGQAILTVIAAVDAESAFEPTFRRTLATAPPPRPKATPTGQP